MSIRSAIYFIQKNIVASFDFIIYFQNISQFYLNNLEYFSEKKYLEQFQFGWNHNWLFLHYNQIIMKSIGDSMFFLFDFLVNVNSTHFLSWILHFNFININQLFGSEKTNSSFLFDFYFKLIIFNHKILGIFLIEILYFAEYLFILIPFLLQILILIFLVTHPLSINTEYVKSNSNIHH